MALLALIPAVVLWRVERSERAASAEPGAVRPELPQANAA
jgi:hypothetical protein